MYSNATIAKVGACPKKRKLIAGDAICLGMNIYY